MGKKKKASKSRPAGSVTVDISKATLDALLKSKDLQIGKNVRVIKTLEIKPGTVVAKQYDR